MDKIEFEKKNFENMTTLLKYFDEIFLYDEIQVKENKDKYVIEFNMLGLVCNVDFSMIHCDNNKCYSSISCIRYLNYQKIKNTNHNNKLINTIFSIEDKKICNLFLKWGI